MGGGDAAPGDVGCRQVFLVDADVEAGLLELFFDIDLALLHERQQIAAQPRNLGEREAVFSEIDRLAGEVRGCGFALCGSGIAVSAEQTLLELNGADGGVDLQRRVEAGVVSAGQRGQKLRGPGTAVAAVGRKTLIDL